MALLTLLLALLGAELELVPSSGGMGGAIGRARELAAEIDAVPGFLQYALSLDRFYPEHDAAASNHCVGRPKAHDSAKPTAIANPCLRSCASEQALPASKLRPGFLQINHL